MPAASARTAPHVIIAEPQLELRSAMIGILREMSIPEVRLVSDAKELRSVLKTGITDLLVINYNFDNGDDPRVVRDLRMDYLGDSSNPFTAVIMTSWDTGDAPVRMALGTGVDDLLIFPLPMGLYLVFASAK